MSKADVKPSVTFGTWDVACECDWEPNTFGTLVEAKAAVRQHFKTCLYRRASFCMEAWTE